MVYNQKIISFSHINEDEEFKNSSDGLQYNLKDFLQQFPYVYFKSGIWNEYEKMPVKKAIERAQKSPYGANIYITYNHQWEVGENNGFCQVNIECPAASDLC